MIKFEVGVSVDMRYVLAINKEKLIKATIDSINEEKIDLSPVSKEEDINTCIISDNVSIVIPHVVVEFKIPSIEKQLWKKYQKLVWKITDKQPIKKLKNHEKRGFKNYHLDHKVSIWYGYQNKIDPKIIGGIDNLEFIPYKDNMKKSKKCNFCGAKNLQTVLFYE